MTRYKKKYTQGYKYTKFPQVGTLCFVGSINFTRKLLVSAFTLEEIKKWQSADTVSLSLLLGKALLFFQMKFSWFRHVYSVVSVV